jgi:hypothetical protein
VNVKENLKDSTNLSKKDYTYMKRKSNFDLQEEELSDRLITYQKIQYQAKIIKLMGQENVGIRVMQQQGKVRMNNK